jgi:hypothetical protein
MSWKTALYSTPERYGLQVLGEADASPGYEWDIFVVYRDLATGELYTVADGGCSCNSASDAIQTRDDLSGPHTVAEVHAQLDEWAKFHATYLDQASAVELHAKLAEI